MIVKWNPINTKGITLSTGKINTLCFADDQVIIADSDDNLQRGVLTLQNRAKNFGMGISPENSEMMTF
jgi:hypothetical protein